MVRFGRVAAAAAGCFRLAATQGFDVDMDRPSIVVTDKDVDELQDVYDYSGDLDYGTVYYTEESDDVDHEVESEEDAEKNSDFYYSYAEPDGVKVKINDTGQLDGMRGLRKQRQRKNYPALGSSAQFKWEDLNDKGNYVFTVQYVARRTDNKYPPPPGCRPSQGRQLIEDRFLFNQMKSLIYGAKRTWNTHTMPGFVGNTDPDKEGGLCAPGIDDPVMGVGDSIEQAGRKRGRMADFWMSEKMFAWNPNYRKKRPVHDAGRDCNILTQRTGFLFWVCNQAINHEVTDTMSLLSIIAETNLQVSMMDRGIQDLASQISTVGCWCPKILGGQSGNIALMGEALNYEIDVFCRQWSRCIKCGDMPPNNCGAHIFGTGYALEENFGAYSCSNSNPPCLRARCECDVQLANRVTGFLSTQPGQAIDDTFTNIVENGEVDRCQRGTFFGDLSDRCCGYTDDAPDWKLYNEAAQCCLDDGTVRRKRFAGATCDA